MSYTLGALQLNLRVNDERTNMQIVGRVGEDSMNVISLKVCAILSIDTELQSEKKMCVPSCSL